MLDTYNMTRDILLKLSRHYNITKLRQIINNLPPKLSLQRKSLEGLIKFQGNRRAFNLNNYLDYDHEDETITRFMETLKTKLSHCDLSSFYERVKTLKIENGDKDLQEKLKKELGKDFAASYFSEPNKLVIFSANEKTKEEVADSKTHELLHMASQYDNSNYILSGFSKYDEVMNIGIGVGLNEGFTEYLNMKYFSKKERFSYYRLTGLAGQIGNIIGQEEIEKFYFANDLNGVIKDLEKYTSRDKALELIIKMDTIYKMLDHEELKNKRVKLQQEARVDVANIALEKYRQEYSEGKISEQKYKESIYNMELYINGIETIWQLPYIENRTSKPEKIGFSESASSDPLSTRIIIEIPYYEYEKKINNYYDSLPEDFKFRYQPWTDSEGKTTRNYLQVQAAEFQRRLYAAVFKSNQSSQTPQELTHSQELKQMVSEPTVQTSTTTTNTVNQVPTKK